MFEHLSETEVPEDLSLFEPNGEKYPTLSLVEAYIQEVSLKAGDCLFVPSYHFHQLRTANEEATFIGFSYSAASKLSELFIKAVQDGLLDKE